MRAIVASFALLSAAMAGCAPQLSPPQMIGDESSDLAVKEFLFAGEALAADYGLDVEASYLPQPRISQDPFGISVVPAVPYTFKIRDRRGYPSATIAKDRYERRAWFIRAGYHASQMICRNYLSGLRDRNEYFEFLQKEFNTGSSLVQVLMPLTGVAEKTKDVFTQAVNSTNLGIDAYQTFKFMTPEIETILPLVESAQAAVRDYYLTDGVPATFAGALNAVSKIEYQCSRAGIRALLNKTLIQAKPQYKMINGTLYSMEAKDANPKDPNEQQKPPAGAPAANPKPKSLPAQAAPVVPSTKPGQ
jgi:hypothetical protein